MQTIKYLGSKFWILQFNMILNAAEYWQCRIQSYWYDPVSVRFNPFPMSALLYFANQQAGKGHNLLTTRLHLSVSSMRILFKLICIDFRNLQLMCLDNHDMRLVWFGYRYDMVSTSIIWFGYPGYEYDTAWIYPGYEYIQEMTISRKWIYPGNEYDMMVNSPSRGCGRSPGDCLGFQIQQMQEPVGAPCKKSMKLYYQLWRSRNAWTIEHCQGWWWRGRRDWKGWFGGAL